MFLIYTIIVLHIYKCFDYFLTELFIIGLDECGLVPLSIGLPIIDFLTTGLLIDLLDERMFGLVCLAFNSLGLKYT